ncbi:MAG: DUF4258 domain-containing protein [Bacteroidia bacterium]|nr:DUF4258 domain-containing protein [Bacteroidia bacterium]
MIYLSGVFMGLIIVFTIKTLRNDDIKLTTEEQKEVLKVLQANPLTYSKNAECRVDCRNISEKDVKQLLQNGNFNFNEKSPVAEPCPSYILEGKTADGKLIRVTYLSCDNETRVSSAIDLNKNYKCDCWGKGKT